MKLFNKTTLLDSFAFSKIPFSSVKLTWVLFNRVKYIISQGKQIFTLFMVRIKKGTLSRKKRKKLLKGVKGFKWGRKSKYRAAKGAFLRKGRYAYFHRKTKKREFRRLWQIQINAGCRKYELNYSSFIKKLKENKIEINRKILAILARDFPETFEKIVQKVK